MKRYITILSVLLATIASFAQVANDSINRMVLVESTYNPIIAGAVKRNFTPEEVKPSMNKEAAVYADESMPLTQFKREAHPTQTMAVTPEKGMPGYAHFGMGNYTNIDGMAAYKFRFKESNELALKGHINGWNGNYLLPDYTKWHSYLYDMALAADYRVSLGQASLSAGINAAHYRYNYLTDSIADGATDAQKSNHLSAYIGIKGSAWEHYYYQANANYTYFDRSVYFAHKVPHSENHIHVDGSLSRDLYDWGMATVELRSDVLTYSGLSDYTNYFSLGITPRWNYRLADFRFVSGFNLDFLGGNNMSRPVQMSPEFGINYIPSKLFSAELTLDGGRDIHTFSSLYALSPYWASEQQLRPSYTFMNAHLSGHLRIIEGLHLNVGGGYKIVSDALFETAIDTLGTTYTGYTNHAAQVATADASISYTHKDLVSVSAEGAYYYWMLKDNNYLLARAPQIDANVEARVRIIPNLYTYTDLQLVVFNKTEEAPRERAIINWSLGANYALNKHFTFFLDAHNLLNRRHSYYAGYPSQGFNILAGAMFKF